MLNRLYLHNLFNNFKYSLNIDKLLDIIIFATLLATHHMYSLECQLLDKGYSGYLHIRPCADSKFKLTIRFPDFTMVSKSKQININISI